MKKTPFMKFHWVLVAMYLAALLLGMTRGLSGTIRSLHPYAGLGVIVVPAAWYVMSGSKKAIRAMLASNFKKARNLPMAVARATTVLMMAQILLMVLSGATLHLDLAPGPGTYRAALAIHRSAVVLVPVLAVVHAAGRKLSVKKNKSRA